MVHIVVCLKRTVDVTQLRADAQTRKPILRDTPYRISDFDENALEEAVRLKEKHGGKVTALTAGPPEAREIMRKALAMGADEAYVVGDKALAEADPLVTARALVGALRKLGGWQLVLCGEGSVDAYNAQVGPRVAEGLGIPQLTYVSKVELRDGRVVGERSLEDTVEVVEATLPALLSVTMEINQPRLPTLLQIMGASKKPLTTWSAKDIGVTDDDLHAAVETLDLVAPQAARRRQRFEGEPEKLAREVARLLIDGGWVKP